MTFKRLGFFAVFAVVATISQTAQADFKTGWTAYQKEDFRAALSAWQPLAESGNPQAQFNVGHLFDEGKGVAQDSRRAVAWWRKAAEQGFIEASPDAVGLRVGRCLGLCP